ncbi:unnamed protein product [Amoebophrya sp. A120]|nr:unnamed protein product [Amoebophrya sp. A120]|eukprot:GSA120T00005940001.1
MHRLRSSCSFVVACVVAATFPLCSRGQEWKDNLFAASDAQLSDIRDMLLGHSVDGEIKDSLKEATALVLQQKGAELAHAVSMYVEDMKELESVRKNLLQALGKELPENSPLHEAVDQWAELVHDAVLKKYNANPARAGSDAVHQAETSGNVYQLQAKNAAQNSEAFSGGGEEAAASAVEVKGDSSTKMDGRDRTTAAAVPAAGGEKAGTASMRDGHSAAPPPPPPPAASTPPVDDAQHSAAGAALSSERGVVVSGAALGKEQEAPADAARAGAVLSTTGGGGKRAASTSTSFTEEGSEARPPQASNGAEQNAENKSYLASALSFLQEQVVTGYNSARTVEQEVGATATPEEEQLQKRPKRQRMLRRWDD